MIRAGALWHLPFKGSRCPINEPGDSAFAALLACLDRACLKRPLFTAHFCQGSIESVMRQHSTGEEVLRTRSLCAQAKRGDHFLAASTSKRFKCQGGAGETSTRLEFLAMHPRLIQNLRYFERGISFFGCRALSTLVPLWDDKPY